MSIVKPLRGLRPQPQYAKAVAAPPYDVLNAKEAREMAKGNPISFLRVNKAEIEFDDNIDVYSEPVYQRGKENLQKLIKDGIMVREAKPCFYLYRLTMDGRQQHGIVSLASVEEYGKGLIKKHEHTRPEKVKDRTNHILKLEAQVGSIFLTFRSNPEIKKIFAQVASKPPLINFIADDGIGHELWIIDDEKMHAAITAAFAKLPCLYVADGHHRSQSAYEVGRQLKEKNPSHTGKELYNYFLATSFPDDELKILPYNRVVKDLNGMTLNQLFEKAKGKFDISEQPGPISPDKVHQFGVYCEGKWYLMKAKEGTFNPKDPVGSIDAAILADNFIVPLLGIADPKTDKRIKYIGGIRGTKELVKLVDSGEQKIAFSLYPTSIEQLLNVADANEVMPAKSTWFEPKLRSGMVVNLLND